MDSPKLPSVHTIVPLLAAFPASSSMPRHNSSLATSYASYVVRVHTRHGIKTLTFDVLAQLFTFTAKKAAEDLGISSRTLIRVCRSLGIRRWPYLGFRSEKNVERIRQEAMENLRRMLAKEGESQPTAVLHPNAPSLRGASAKRLLQVKMPQLRSSSLKEAMPLKTSVVRASSCCLSRESLFDTISTSPDNVKRSNESFSITKAPLVARPSPTFAVLESPANTLLSPPPTDQTFKFDLQHVSPSKHSSVAASTGSPYLDSNTWTARKTSTQIPTPCKSSPIPSLNLLVDASIFTSSRNETPAEQKGGIHQLSTHNRTMSMKDILTLRH